MAKINVTPPLSLRSKFPLIQFLGYFIFLRCFVQGFNQEVESTSFSRFDNYIIADQSNSKLQMAWIWMNEVVLWIIESLAKSIFSNTWWMSGLNNNDACLLRCRPIIEGPQIIAGLSHLCCEKWSCLLNERPGKVRLKNRLSRQSPLCQKGFLKESLKTAQSG